MSILRTRRLDLVPASAQTLELLIAGEYGRAGEALGAVIPDGWPHEPQAISGLPWHLHALQDDPSALLWRVRLLVLRVERRVIGSINLKGPPDAVGTIEIGWGVALEYRKHGIATEGTRAVIDWVMTQSSVRTVIATIPNDNRASQSVAERVGMSETRETRRGLSVWALRKDETAPGRQGATL